MIFLKKQHILLGLLSVLAVVILLTISYLSVSKWAQEQIVANAKYESSRIVDTVNELHSRVKQMLKSIRVNQSFEKYVSNNYSSVDSSVVNSLFMLLSYSEQAIMQLRYIDKDGNEQIRVDREKYGSTLFLSNEKSLQNKKHRYYFQEISKLKKGEIWSSRLDLNIENNKIDIPYRPTIRIGTPVYDNGKFSGILVINLFMEHILLLVKKNYLYNVYITSINGDYVIHPNEKFNFSSSLNGDYKLIDDFPSLAKNIQKDEFVVGTVYMKTLLKGSDELLKIIFEPKNNLVKEFEAEVFLYSLLIALAGAAMLFMMLFYPVRYYLNRSKKIISLRDNELQTILNEANIAILCVNNDKKIVYINNSALDMLHISFDEISSFSIEMLFPDNKLDEILFTSYTSTVDIDVAVKNNKQEVFPANLRVHHEGDINYGYNLFFIRDLTKTQEKELYLLEHSKRAAMGDMLMAISHQWRQPLTSMGFAIQYLEAAYKDGKFDEALLKETVLNTNSLIHFMSDTIDDFQYFLKQPKDKEFFLDYNFFDFIIRLVEPILEKENIRLQVQNNLPSGMQYLIKSQSNELQQVLLNLINNAQDALVEGRKSNIKLQNDIIIVVISFDKKDNNLIIKVIDNNNGINEDIVGKIFDPYFTTKGVSGNGIGLYIVKMIVERHFCGNIFVKNLKKGAMFTVVIPVQGGLI